MDHPTRSAAAVLAAASGFSDPLPHLILLADGLRPSADESAEQRWQALNRLLADRDDLRRQLQALVLELFASREQVSFYADAGVLPNSSFGAELRRLIANRLLPEVPDPSRLRDCFRLIFHRRGDRRWLAGIQTATWDRFWELLGDFDERDRPRLERARHHLGAALRMIAYRIASVGLAPEVRRVAGLEEGQYPFMAVATAVDAWLNGPIGASADAIRRAAGNARRVVDGVHSAAARAGTSLTLTYCLEHLRENLNRLELLTRLLADTEPEHRRATWSGFLRSAVIGDLSRDGIRRHVGRLTRLLALRVTDNASRTGEHYIAEDRREYVHMWQSAMLGGLVIAVMALFKILLGKLDLAPANQALAYGLNYGLGFMLIQLIGGTVATKQPAMTAATLAAAIDAAARSPGATDRITATIAGVIRTQTAAILGNVGIALPLALLLGLVMGVGSPGTVVDAAKAEHLLADIHPLTSPAIPHAAIAGICLFLAGLISGYVDNVAAYDRLGDRVAHLQWLRRAIGADQARRFGGFIDHNLGALAGNFLFGLMLGGAGFIGFIFGLPLDIRHIAFASANLGYAGAALGAGLGWTTLAWSILGLMAIAATNLAVSFSLAFGVALRSRGLHLAGAWAFLRHLPGEMLRQPGRFLLPPRA